MRQASGAQEANGQAAVDTEVAPQVSEGGGSAVRAPRRPTFLHRGEAFVASFGLLLAAILLLAIGASAWLLVQPHRATIDSMRAVEIESAAGLLADTVPDLLAHDELSAVRRLLIDTARERGFSECRLVLPGGLVLADAQATRITVPSLPEAWPAGAVEGGANQSADGVVHLSYPLNIPGRGSARLDVVADPTHALALYWEAQVGVSLVGAAALLALLVVYRRMRTRVMTLGLIRDSLLAMQRGQAHPAALAVPEVLGREAVAWNALLREKERLEKQVLGRKAGEALAGRRGGGRELDGACDVLRDGLLIVDKSMRVVYANGAAAVYLRVAGEEMLGAAIGDIVPHLDVHNAIAAALSGAARTWSTAEVQERTSESYGVLRFGVRPLRTDEAASAIVVIEDITQQRIADESRNAFVTQVTHELRSPLTNIRMYAEMAIVDGEQNAATRKQCLNVINRESKRLGRIVEAMLSVAEIEAGKYELHCDDVRLTPLLEDLKEDYEPNAREKGITLSFDLPPKLPCIHADREKISMALHNLVGNAIKYTPDNGRVAVRAEVDDERIRVEVADNGIGIRPEEKERIFEKFYRAADRRVAQVTGSGLGLALAREVVRLHGGEITVESELDKGSTFTMTLPTLPKAA